jgi:hypothetical protein
MDHRRLKIFKISEEIVTNLFRMQGKAFRVISPQWPADATMRGVTHLYECGCFGVRVHSLSFDIVSEGHYIPIEEQQVSIEVLGIAANAELWADAPRMLEVLRTLHDFALPLRDRGLAAESEQAFADARALLEKHGG